MARRDRFFDDLLAVASQLPWQACRPQKFNHACTDMSEYS
jgi:hypothetical protein